MARRKTKRAARIAALNDQLRKNLTNRKLDQVLLSSGLAAKGEAFKTKALAAIAAMEPKDFKRGNDPYGERDFNSFSIEETLCLFKIDYYAKDDLRRASEDPANPDQTTRVMTVMLASDY